MSDRIYTPCNPNAQQCVKNVMKYLSDISFEKILTGQHTQTLAMEELNHIEKITGKQPALLGFELLAYSPNINYFDSDDECLTEVLENYGTLRKAWEWASVKGLITFTWHWFSPLGGRSKAFFSANTDFDATKATIDRTPENIAFISDLDVMAGLLRPFCDKHIPILWRPFHEGHGRWFWWGSKGSDTFIKLYRMMYERFTNVHHLDNLIWVWNSNSPKYYPGDDVVDIISADYYAQPHIHTGYVKEYSELIEATDKKKLALMGEVGVIPSPRAVIEGKTGWVSYMTWSKVFCLSEQFNSFDTLREVYSSPYVVTKDTLPEFY